MYVGRFLLYVLFLYGPGQMAPLVDGRGKAMHGFHQSVNESESLDVTLPPSDAPEIAPTQISQPQAAPQASAPVQPEHQVKQG